MFVFNAKSCRHCCICKNWYDPANSAITPVAPNINQWGITCDPYNDRKMCMRTNLPKSAVDTCGKFEIKVPIR